LAGEEVPAQRWRKMSLRLEAAMATATLIPVTEYLKTTYHPDCDYIDGELKERNVGEQPHASIQGILAGIFRDHRDTWAVRALPEQRVQVAAMRYRIPDVCILRRSDPKDPVVTTPPLICIEVLSKDDTLRELQEKVNDHFGMGVAHVWAIDPWLRIGYTASPRGFVQPEDGVLRVPDTPIAIQLADVFKEWDEM
jgi:Uma2 family endonuclease